jgi:hypothetical protein
MTCSFSSNLYVARAGGGGVVGCVSTSMGVSITGGASWMKILSGCGLSARCLRGAEVSKKEKRRIWRNMDSKNPPFLSTQEEPLFTSACFNPFIPHRNFCP